jgi:hypothetical protein
MEAAMLLSVRQESQTADEAHNMFAGYLYVTSGDFTAGSAHPPLAKDVSALPLLAFHPRIPPMPRGEPFTINLQDGRIFLYSNRAQQMLLASRAAMTVFPLLLALLVFAATREMFGIAPALIALTLTAFEPNLLAHGSLATNDVALATCLFGALYAFWRFVRNPMLWRLATAGLAGGLTLATKHSALLLFPILCLLALVEWLTERRARHESTPASAEAVGEGRATTVLNGGLRGAPVSRQKLAVRLILALIAIGTLSVVSLWAFYAFRYAPVAGPLARCQTQPRQSHSHRRGGKIPSPAHGLSGRVGSFFRR